MRNLDLAKLQEAVASAGDLLSSLQEGNATVGAANSDFAKDRQNLGDADIYEIQDKKTAEMKQIDDAIKESQDLIADIEGIISGSAHAENVVASLNDLKGKLPALLEERKQIDALADEIGKLIHREDLYVTGLP